MVSSIYKKTFSVLMKRPFRLWGISLLAEFLCLVAYAGFIGVPAAAFCAALLLFNFPMFGQFRDRFT